jgi:hypothetical protein
VYYSLQLNPTLISTGFIIISQIISLGNLYSKISEFLFLFNHMHEFLHFYLLFFLGFTSSPLPFCTGGEKQRHLQSKKIATTICFSFPFLSSVPSLLSLSDLSLVLPLHDG